MNQEEAISRTTARLPTPLHVKAKHHAENNGMTLEAFIRKLIEDYFRAADAPGSPKVPPPLNAHEKSDIIPQGMEEIARIWLELPAKERVFLGTTARYLTSLPLSATDAGTKQKPGGKR